MAARIYLLLQVILQPGQLNQSLKTIATGSLGRPAPVQLDAPNTKRGAGVPFGIPCSLNTPLQLEQLYLCSCTSATPLRKPEAMGTEEQLGQSVEWKHLQLVANEGTNYIPKRVNQIQS